VTSLLGIPFLAAIIVAQYYAAVLIVSAGNTLEGFVK